MHRLCEYTLISFKCQSIRSKVHCTNKTLHNESLKNVTVHLGPRVTCAKNMTLPKVYSRSEKLSMSGFIKKIYIYNRLYNVHLSTADLPYHSRSASKSHSLI